MTGSMEETQRNFKNAVDSLIDDLDCNYFRDMQMKMYKCAANCCGDKTSGREGVEKCVDLCNMPMKKVQSVLENELNTMQDQLARCSMSCYDKEVQRFGPDPNKYSVEQRQTFTRNLDKCVADCATTHLALLPKIRDRVVKNIS